MLPATNPDRRSVSQTDRTPPAAPTSVPSGECFLVTAALRVKGLAYDAHEMRMFGIHRRWCLETVPGAPKALTDHVSSVPRIVDAIDSLGAFKASEVYADYYQRGIRAAHPLLMNGEFDKTYHKLCLPLREEIERSYLNPAHPSHEQSHADRPAHISGPTCAIVERMIRDNNLPADCYEFEVFRTFLNGFVSNLPEGPRLLAAYRTQGSSLLAAMDARGASFSRDRCRLLYREFLLDAVYEYLCGYPGRAWARYERMHAGLMLELIQDDGDASSTLR